MVSRRPFRLIRCASLASVVAASLYACTAKLDTKTVSGVALPAAGTSETASGQDSGDGSTFVVKAVDLAGLNTVSTDFGPLKGFSVQAPNGIDAATTLTASIDMTKTFPFTLSGDKALSSKLRISLPDALLVGIDLSHPESIAVYVRSLSGDITQLPADQISVESPHLYLMVGDFQSFVVVQSRPALALAPSPAYETTKTPTLSWSPSPVGSAPEYQVQVLDSTCTQVISTQKTDATTLTLAPPLAEGDACVTIAAVVEGAALKGGEPKHFIVDVTPPAPFVVTSAKDLVTKDPRPTITWEDAPRLNDGTVTYAISFDGEKGCPSPSLTKAELKAASFTPAADLASGVYYICVNAVDAAGNKTNAGGSDFKINIDHDVPPGVSLSGVSGSSTNNPTPAILWSASTAPTAVTYAVALDTDAGCPTPVASATGLSVTTYTPPALADGLYHVCLTVTDALGNSGPAANSDSFTLRIDSSSPSAFALTGASGALSATGKPTINWSAPSDFSSLLYTVKIDDNSNCASPVLQSAPQAATSFTPPTTLGDGIYYVCVEAADAAGNPSTASSGTFTVDVDHTPPSTFTIAGSSGSVTADNTPTVTWGAATDAHAVTYDVKLDNNSNCQTPEAQSTGQSSLTFTPGSSLADGTYTVCVTAKDAAGNNVAATNAGTFTVAIDTTAPAAFTITAPASSTSATSPPISWGTATDLHTVTYVAQLFQTDCTTSIESSGSVAASPYNVTASLLTNHDYCIKVRATDVANNFRDATNNSYHFTVNAAQPGNPGTLTATPGNTTIGLSWVAATAATGYIVIRHTSAAVDWVPTAGTSYTAGTAADPSNDIICVGNGTTCNNTGLTNGTTYHYAVYAYNAALAYSAASSVANAVPSAGGGDDVWVGVITNSSSFVHFVETVGSTMTDVALSPTYAGFSTLAVDKNGNVHYAGSSDALKEHRYTLVPNGVSETIQATTAGADSSSIAVDSTNTFHLLYNDGDGISYKTGVAGNFLASPVALLARTGASLSEALRIVVDKYNKPHALFYDKTNNRVRYGTQVLGAWTLTPLATFTLKSDGTTSCTAAVTFADMAVDANGKAHVIYACDTQYVYAKDTGGSWTYSLAYDNNSTSATRPSVALDSTGLPAFVGTSSTFLICRKFNGSIWSDVSTTHGVFSGAAPVMAFDSANRAHIFYNSAAGVVTHLLDDAILASVNVGTAVEGFTRSPVVIGQKGASNFNLTPNQTIFAAYGLSGNLSVKSRGASTWSTQTYTSVNVNDGSVVVDKNGKAHVSASDAAAMTVLYADNTSGFPASLETVQIGLQGPFGSMSVDSSNLVHFAYSDGAKILYEAGTSGSFNGSQTLIYDPSIAMTSSATAIAVDNSDVPHIVFKAPTGMTTKAIFYSYKNGASWTTTSSGQFNFMGNGSTSCGGTTDNPDFAIDISGKIHITYNCTGELVYATNQSGSWVYSTIDYIGVASARASVAFNSAGVLYATYYNTGGMLNFARYSAGVWTQTLVAPSAAAVDPAIGFDPNDTLHILYVDSVSGDILHYARTAAGLTSTEVVTSGAGNGTKFLRGIAIQGVEGKANH